MERVAEHVKTKYGYDPGSYTDFPADESNKKLLVRLDWNINEKNRLALRYNYTNNLQWNAPNASSMDGGTRSAYGRTANFTVDGANFNNNFGLSDNLPGGGNPISLDAIEELQVVISPYDVRQTNFIGGGVNAITKSGTNTFKGTAYVYHKNEYMRGDYVDGEAVSGARDKDRNTIYGLTLGGPIIKNKLFFFVSAEMAKSPSVAVRWRASENGVGSDIKYLSYLSLIHI